MSDTITITVTDTEELVEVAVVEDSTTVDITVSDGVTPAYVAAAIAASVPPAPAWGAITGTLSDQADLQAALDATFDGAYSSLSGIPSTFTPSSHTHPVSELSDATANGQSLISAANYAAMRTLLDLEAGTDFYSVSAADAAFAAIGHNHSGVYQPLATRLTDIAALTATDGNIIVGTGTTWVAESGATARTSLGLGTGNTPEFAGVNVPLLSPTAHVVSQQNSTNAQTLRVYATALASNESYLQLSTSTTAQTIAAIGNGTNANADLVLTPAGTGVVKIAGTRFWAQNRGFTTQSETSNAAKHRMHAYYGDSGGNLAYWSYNADRSSGSWVRDTTGHNALGLLIGRYSTVGPYLSFWHWDGTGNPKSILAVNGTDGEICIGSFTDAEVMTTRNARLSVLATIAQLRLGYDAANYNSFTVGATGTLTIAATGTNPDIVLTPAGTGNIKFGTHSSIGAETVTGYITIKDSGGTSRKIAVVS